ncbi:Small integral membrane protein [Caenorhabditis elegans]|uniref:Small integral membrane protein n=1 Tax=Caenorhabditis elegans TaxID=6239 RepID=N1NSF4_CAEEL|nr:Small integral membrane protein [Caenorhabditis elegans]CCW45981.1 Small integral membrane protein [Caenorhabditis elegans]|eukprot:NP_001294076.1 Uncharacterized protein CELE_F08A7.1 [Caenorhabditis elegans]
MPSDILDLETLHTPEVKENAIETSRKSRKMFSFIFILTTFLLLFSATTFLILGFTNYKSCSVEPRIHIWMIFVGVLLISERIIAIRSQLARINFRRKRFEYMNQEQWLAWKTEKRRLNSRPLSQGFLWLMLVLLWVFRCFEI